MRESNSKAKDTAVEYTYRDYSHITPDTPVEDIEYEDKSIGATMPGGTRGTDSNFPAKLHHILSQPDLAHIVTWLPHGRSWRLVDRQAFLTQVMPNYFSHSNYASFARQVNGWGFKRMSRKGMDYGSYYHELFLRGMPHVAKRMRRPLKIGKKICPDPENEPKLDEISREHPLPKLSPRQWPFSGITSGKGKKASILSNHGAESQLKNLFQSSSLFQLRDASKSAQDHHTSQSLRHSDLLSGAAMLSASSGSLAQDSILKTLYQKLQPQESTVQALLNQYNETSLRQESTNDMLVSNMLQYNNLLGRSLMNPLGSRSHNMASFKSTEQDIQLALLQQRLRQSQSNLPMDHHFSLTPPETLRDSMATSYGNSLSTLGFGANNKLTRLNEITGTDLTSLHASLTSGNHLTHNGDDERSISSDIF